MNKLFKKPDADVYKNRSGNDKRMGAFRKSLFNGSVDYHKDHRAEIENEIEKINAVKRAVNFFKGGNSVYVNERNRFVINVKNSRACRKKKNKNAENRKAGDVPAFITDLTIFHYDNKHYHWKKNGTEIRKPVCPKGIFESS